MSWSREEVLTLLEEYQKWPNLYNVKSPNYKNRNLRQRALEAILDVLKVLKPNVTINDIQTKFLALKQNATRERKKWLESQKSGAGSDEIFEPSLWYYNEISFIFDTMQPRKSVDSLSLEENEENIVLMIEEEHSQTEELSFAEPPLTSPDTECTGILNTPSCSSSSCSAPKKRKRKVADKKDSILGDVSNTLRTISKRLTEEVPKVASNISFGQYVESKLDQIDDEDIRDEVELSIIGELTKALKECRERKKNSQNVL